METIWESELEKGKNLHSTSSKDWRPMLFVLKRSGNVPMLSMYRDTKKRWQKQTAKGIIALSPWVHVSIAHECSYKYTFTVKHPEGSLILAAKDGEIMDTWLAHLQQQVSLNTKEGEITYEVEAVLSEDMNKLLLASGRLLLQLSHEEIRLAHAHNLTMIANWPLGSLRKYSAADNMFTIEMGRRSPRGQGRYSFKTSKDGELFDIIQGLIKKAANSSASTSQSLIDRAGATSGKIDIDSRPPAPLPPSNHPPPPLPPKDNSLDDVDTGGIRLKYDSVTEAELQMRRQGTLTKSINGKVKGEEDLPSYDVTQHNVDEIPQPNDHIYDVLQHDKGPITPNKPNLAAYDTVELKKDENQTIPPGLTYDVAFTKNGSTDGADDMDRQPVCNPVYAASSVMPINPMYGTSADVESVKKSLENLALSSQEDDGPSVDEIDDKTPPVPPQNF